MMLRTFLLAVIILMFTGCGSGFQILSIHPDTRTIEPSLVLDPNAVLKSKAFNNMDNIRFVFLSQCSSNPQFQNDYLMMMYDFFSKLGMQEMLTQAQMLSLIDKIGLSKEIQSLNDTISLRKIIEKTGPFLIIKCWCVHLGNAFWEHYFYIFDPSSNETLLEIKHRRTNWANSRNEIINPVLNYVVRWADESWRLSGKK